MAAAIDDWARSSPDNTRYAPEKALLIGSFSGACRMRQSAAVSDIIT